MSRNAKTTEALKWIGHVIANYVTGDMDHEDIAETLSEETFAGLSDDFGTPARHLDALSGLHALRVALNAQVDNDARAARDAGATWEQIGKAVGMSRQAAHEKYGPSRK